MHKKNKIIISLLAAAAILFCIIRFWAAPANREKQNEYALNQTDSLTHDISSIEEFKNPYVGNASNTGNLFYSLPLCNIPMKFEIDSEACALTVNYLETVWNIGEEKVQRDLIYNSVAAMAVIDNLQEISYNFSGVSYSFHRQQIEEAFDIPLSELIEQENWSNEVQGKLESADFVAQFLEK